MKMSLKLDKKRLVNKTYQIHQLVILLFLVCLNFEALCQDETGDSAKPVLEQEKPTSKVNTDLMNDIFDDEESAGDVKNQEEVSDTGSENLLDGTLKDDKALTSKDVQEDSVTKESTVAPTENLFDKKVVDQIEEKQDKPEDLAKDAGVKFLNMTDLKDPLKIRDPFKSNLKKVRGPRKSFDKKSLGGQEAVSSIDINVMKIVGVLVGKDKRAFAKVGNDVIILKEGMEIGPDKVVLKAILPGGVVLVEKIINVYGQEEYLETIIPIDSGEG